MRKKLSKWLEHPLIERGIMAIIVFNAILLGVGTSESAMSVAGPAILALEKMCVSVYVLEILLKLIAHRWKFFKNGWNIIDFLIVGFTLLPNFESFSVLRVLRILRVLRLITIAPALQRAIEGFFSATPSIGSVFMLMGVMFYVGGVMATNLFAATFPEWFGTLGLSLYSLFQIVTLESWSMGIVRPVMEVHPYAWMFFVPYIMVTTFVVMNLLIGVIVSSMQDAHSPEANKDRIKHRDEVLERLTRIEKHLAKKPDEDSDPEDPSEQRHP